MDVIMLANEYWPLLTGGIGLVVWLVRLEGKHSENEKSIARLEKQVDVLETKHNALDSKLMEQLADVREALARIEGALGINK